MLPHVDCGSLGKPPSLSAGTQSPNTGLPLGLVGTLATVASIGRQRGLRQQLREVLDPVVKACDEYQCGVDDYLTEKFLRTTAEKLLILSERDGLKSPNTFHIGCFTSMSPGGYSPPRPPRRPDGRRADPAHL